ncbi:MAG: hypothetical protein ABH803_00635 [Candidatus Micrarchaeota archaeon]
MAKEKLKHFEIDTHAGKAILNNKTSVWVKTSEGEVAKKKVEHLTEGDQILSRNAKIRTSLDEIKEVLKKENLAYRKAHDTLHTSDKTRLQEFLFHIHSLSEQELEDKEKRDNAVSVIKERLDKVNARADRIYGDKKTLNLTRSNQAIDSWINGKTVLPRDLQTLRILHHLNPEKFEEYFGDPNEIKKGEKGSVGWAHSFWMKNHQTLVRWLNGLGLAKTNTEQFEIPSKLKKKSESLEEQRQVVYDKLIKPLWQEILPPFSFVRVKGITEVPKIKKPNKSGLGILDAGSFGPEKIKLKRTDYGRAYRNIAILEKILELTLENTPLKFKAELATGKTAKTIPPLNEILEKEKNFTGKTMLYFLIGEHAGQNRREELEEIKKENDIITQAIEKDGVFFEVTAKASELQNTINEKEQQIVNGELDEENGVEKETFLKILESVKKTRKNNPGSTALYKLHALMDPNTQMRIKKKQISQAEITNAKKRVIKDLDYYGIPLHLLIPDEIPYKCENITDAKEAIEQFIQNTQGLPEFKQINYETQRKIMMPPTKEEVTNAIKSTGIKNEDTIKKLLDRYGRHNFLT